MFRLLAALGILSGISLAAIPASERAVLVNLYNLTGGDGWTNKTNWNGSPGTECTWFGVTCSGDNVTGITMIFNQLSGSLPPLAGLTKLAILNLPQNQLTGSIPPLTGLTNLWVVDLDFNDLSGSIPALSESTNLLRLHLRSNQLTGPIPEFTGLTELGLVYLDNNQLTGSIPGLTGLTKLSSLNLSQNQLSGSIPSLVGLNNLTSLYLHSNQLTGPIPPLTGLAKLQFLSIGSNQLSGPIPSLTDLTELIALYLSYNDLSGMIPSLTGLPNLTYVQIENNQLTGTIPSLLGVPKLSQLALSNNRLTGTIPPLSGLTSLSQLTLGTNQITGTIPPLAGLTNLRIVNLAFNQLTGTMPAAPPGLLVNQSRLCPNYLTPSIDAAWDAATGVTPWSKACNPPPPTINTGGVVGLYNIESTIQAGSWISIYGENLAASTTVWNGNFPTTLNGTSVTINNKLGYLWFVSPTLINVQAPDDVALGPVEVKVTTASGTFTSTVTLAQASPSFNLLDTKHVCGIILRFDGSGAHGGGSYDIVGPTGTSLGYETVAAKAGDKLVLFGVGFGPTSPPVPAGKVYSGAAQATLPIQFIINGANVTPDWAGISAAGLFQFNLTVPPGLGTGDQQVRAVVNSVMTPTGVVLALQ